MRQSCSNTAEFGDFMCPRVIGQVKENIKTAL